MSLLTTAVRNMWIFQDTWSPLGSFKIRLRTATVNLVSIATFKQLESRFNSFSVWQDSFQSNHGGSMLSTQGKYAISDTASYTPSPIWRFVQVNIKVIWSRMLGISFKMAACSPTWYVKSLGSKVSEQTLTAARSKCVTRPKRKTKWQNENTLKYVN